MLKDFVIILRETKKVAINDYLTKSTNDFETIIYKNCKNKDEVKEKLLKEYSEYFPNGKVFQRSKDNEYIYAVIYEIDNYWRKYWLEPVKCPVCKIETTRINIKNNKIYFKYDCCSKECLKIEEKRLEDEYIINNPNKTNNINAYIYKITQISTGKCYIGKTTNHFIWRWWDHLKANTDSKFHIFLKDVDITDIRFEILKILPKDIENSEILKVESDYIREFDSIKNGFNTLISNKEE